MKMNILKPIVLMFAAFPAVVASAQNLDPTVVVNRAYEGKLMEVHKPALDMAVPDSIQQFNLDFDYSVFENPYKGSYEFKPYQLLMKPYAAVQESAMFYLRAGAGYTVHPELDLVWTPLSKGKFKMNVYASHRSYFGEYRSFKPTAAQNGAVTLDRWQTREKASAFWDGYAMKSRAGNDGRYDWKKGFASFDVGYLGVASKDTVGSRMFNALDMNLRVASKPHGDNYFMYDADVDFRMGGDGTLSEHIFSMNAKMGPVLTLSHRILFDLGLDLAGYSGAFASSVSELYVVPHYIFTHGRWNVDLGVRIAKLFKHEESEMYQVKDQIVYPDVEVRFAAIPDALSIYAKAEGGNRINTYSSLLERNPFVNADYGRGTPLLDASIVKYDISVGLDGRISRNFSYDLYAGYADYRNALLDAVCVSESASGMQNYLPGIGYASYGRFFAGLDWDLYTERVSFDGKVEYSHVSDFGEQAHGLFQPAALSGNTALEYNWNRRIFVGVDCRFATARKGTLRPLFMELAEQYVPVEAHIPAYADLGLYAEVSVSRKLSFWLRGGNLLNMTVQQIPLYAEKGINFTAGICLKL